MQNATSGKLFSDVLRDVENGHLIGDLTEKLNEVVAAVLDTRKPGKLSLSIDIKPTGKGTVNLDADINAKVPEHDRPTTTFFIGQDLSLQRRDPNQPDLPLTAVPDNRDEPLRVVND